MAVSQHSRRATLAVDDLYRKHAAEVFRYAYAMLGNRADAEDVTQTTFVNALRALERGEFPRNGAHWLVAIAHNLVRQRFRQARDRPLAVEFDTDAVAARPPSSADEDELSVDELVRALQQIPPLQREALVLREFEGRPYREIQEMLNLSESAVETLLFRARRSLAEELEQLATCEFAELAMSKQADGRLSRKDKRRLSAHLRDCVSCSELATSQAKHRRALKGLALLPLPIPLLFFRGAPSAQAAAGLPTIGGAATTAAGGTAAGAGAGGVVTGVAAKVAVAVVGVALAGGAGYGVTKVEQHHPNPPAPASGTQRARAVAKTTPVVLGASVHAKAAAKVSGTPKEPAATAPSTEPSSPAATSPDQPGAGGPAVPATTPGTHGAGTDHGAGGSPAAGGNGKGPGTVETKPAPKPKPASADTGGKPADPGANGNTGKTNQGKAGAGKAPKGNANGAGNGNANGKATAPGQTKTDPSTPADPAVPATPADPATGDPTHPATPATPATPASGGDNGNANGSGNAPTPPATTPPAATPPATAGPGQGQGQGGGKSSH